MGIKILFPHASGVKCLTRQSQTADSATGVATREVILSARKVVPCFSVGLQLVLLHTFYSEAQCCVCTALQLGGDVEQRWLMRKYDVIHKPEVHNISLRQQRRTKPRPQSICPQNLV